QYVGDFSEGLAVIQVKDKQGYIDTSGKVIVKPVFEPASEFKNGLARVNYGGEWGYINKEGEFVYKPKGFDLW
ncbi:MAG TPA: WG repeat-containing protein, partial [Pseudobacteroides sp.]